MKNVLIQQALLIFFFFLPLRITDSKNSCPSSSCGSTLNSIKYPFKLEEDRPPKTCHDYYINLRCYKDQLMINLPSSGDFYVTDIDYYTKIIGLSDPGNCLPRRVMTKFSVHPLEVLYYQNYTYYTCPRSVVARYDEFSKYEVHCLSNSTSATIAVTSWSAGFMERLGCQPIVSSLVPVMTKNGYDYMQITGELWLTWNTPGCDSYGKDCNTSSGDPSRKKWTKFFRSHIFIPSAVVLATFFGAACFLRLYEFIKGRCNESNNATSGQASNPTAISGSTAATSSATPDTVDNLKAINSCTEILVISNESQEASVSYGSTHMMNCSICLEEYVGKDTIRKLVKCGHYFHAECIDRWLINNITCPVCRIPLPVSQTRI